MDLRKFQISNFKFQTRGGYTLLVALLVMGIIMASSIALSGIVMQGLKISHELDDAVVAFYAAESGIEENLYFISSGLACKSDAPSPAFASGASWVRTCTGTTEKILQTTGIYRTYRMALQVRMSL